MAFFDFLTKSDPFSDAIRRLFSSVVDALGRFFDSLFQAELQVEDNVKKLHENFVTLKDNVPKQIDRVKNFKFDPKWSTRVINVTIAIEQMRSLVIEVATGWHDRIDSFREPLHEFVLIFKAEQQSASDPQQQVSAVSKAAVKVDEIATLIQQLAQASDTLVEIDKMFDDILDFFEKLDQFFLQQGNKRRIEKDATPRVRIGKLHS
mgnify:CR=1 FL=1